MWHCKGLGFKETNGEAQLVRHLLSLRKCAPLLLVVLLFISVDAKKKEEDVEELQIGVKYKPKECDIKAHKGDRVKVHYKGALTSGSVFDSSYDRGDPLEFELGAGQVIKGFSSFIVKDTTPSICCLVADS